MELSYKKNVGFLVKSDNGKLAVISQKPVLDGKYDIIIAPEYKGEGYFVSIPGEYEVGKISILAQASDTANNYDLVELMVDDISLVFAFEGFKYSKRVHDSLGDVDVLVSMIEKSTDLKEVLGKFDPEIIVPAGFEDPEKILKEQGINSIARDSIMKVKAERFGSEEFIIEGFILE